MFRKKGGGERWLNTYSTCKVNRSRQSGAVDPGRVVVGGLGDLRSPGFSCNQRFLSLLCESVRELKNGPAHLINGLFFDFALPSKSHITTTPATNS